MLLRCKNAEEETALTEELYQTYLAILKEELVPALGCTEPIAVAYAAAKAAETLGCFPEKLTAACSGNIIKNVMGVVVPNCGGLKGVKAAAVIGAVGGRAELKLEALSQVTEADIERTRTLLEKDFCTVELLESPHNLHIRVTASGGGSSALVEICDSHTNVTCIEKDGERLFTGGKQENAQASTQTDRACLNVEDILAFAKTVQIEDVREVIGRQISYNTRIAEEGLSHSYGVNVGATLQSVYGNDVDVRARAMAAAGSDARMSGCVLPVVINSGSGNQGMTVSLPVITYANELGASEETLYRALVLSNLTAIHQKTRIGRLSAYCGAVSAACGSGAGITYLTGGGYDEICSTITNTLANISGMVCDGAKPSCAAKIASAVDAAIMGHHLAMHSRRFEQGEGIVKDTVEKTIESVGRLGKDGMRETDREILQIMLDD